MPGAYAHLTLVKIAANGPSLEDEPGFPMAAIRPLLRNVRYSELGSISPDYPYLALGRPGDKAWADAMHLERTGAFVRAVARRVRALDGLDQERALAWLLGYVAHVAADVTIHPVVNLKVGLYLDNKRAHRVCEMHQDAYIFQRLNLGPIGLTEHLAQGVLACGDPDRLDPVIVRLWTDALREVHPQLAAEQAPDPEAWHRWLRRVLDDGAEESHRLIPIARHAGVEAGLTYPLADEVDREAYIDQLDTPDGPLSYDQVFDNAVANVRRVWAGVARAVLGEDDHQDAIAVADWSLDSGQDADDRFVFWRGHA